MSERQEHKRRYNQRLEYIAAYDKWLMQEPPIYRLARWHRWKNNKPIWREIE